MTDDVQVRLRLPRLLADRLLQVPPAQRVEVVATGLSPSLRPPSTISLTESEREALRVALGMFRRGSMNGGIIGFRASEEYHRQYADFADDLASLLKRLGGSP